VHPSPLADTSAGRAPVQEETEWPRG
jgi:hypothetical protein